MTKLVLACASLIAVSTLAHAQDTDVQVRVSGVRLEGLPVTTMRTSSPQNAPSGQRIRVSVSESGTNYSNMSKAAVHIGIEVFRDGQNVSMNDIQEVRILDTQGRPIEFQSDDPRDFGPTRGGTSSTYRLTYELVNPWKIHSIGKVTFLFQGKEYDFDVKEPPPRVKQ
jgi:hypothetical protein